MCMVVRIAIGTKKGAFVLESHDNRNSWQLQDPILFGHVVYHFKPDNRNSEIALIATKTGHLGPTIFYSDDGCKTWKESAKPPKFSITDNNRVVDFVFWLSSSNQVEPSTWYAGTSPYGLFKSEDNGRTWDEVESFYKDPLINMIINNCFGTPIGKLTHSININPQDPSIITLAMSTGGVVRSTNFGKSWEYLNKKVLAEFLPDQYPEYGQCVHNLQIHPINPNIMYQQNHCGVYRLNLEENDEWIRIGENMPLDIGDSGFPLIIHPRDVDQIWVVPMDSTDVWPRTSVNGKPALYTTGDGGKSWVRQDSGFPEQNAWFTVMRQATAHDGRDPLGLYIGTKSGEIWASFNQGESWQCIQKNLPEIYSLEVV